jgi:hypothetical protein
MAVHSNSGLDEIDHAEMRDRDMAGGRRRRFEFAKGSIVDIRAATV